MLEIGNFLSDRYEILSKIGAGGMSDVYKAKDHILSRFVAIKVLKSEFSEDSSFVTKFRAEAQSAAGLEHPNIVNIYDVGSEDGLYYIVMEYVEGITLKTYIEKKGQLSFKESASIAIQVARGIEAAHNKDIIHRDIKPQNIIISTEGKVKVTDFGIARAASANTISADVMGSVHYASPEQARNGFVDGRSDIYSLGIVMFEMITGRVPFDGDTTVAVALRHLQEDIARPSIYAPDIPISFEKIILKCTQKTPDRRYQNIEELLVDLRRSLANPDDDFVVIAPLVDNGKTKVIGQDELEKIKDYGIQKPEPKAEPKYEDPDEDEDYDDDDDDEDDDDEGRLLNPKMDKAVTIMGIVTAVIILIVIVYLALSVAGVIKFGSKKTETKEPQTQVTETQKNTQETQKQTESQTKEGKMVSILGMTVDEAQKEVDRLGLDLTVFAFETKESDEKEGTIIEQDIEEGDTVKEGAQINVTIAGKAEKKEETISVPSVIGKTKTSAESAIKSAGLKVSVEYGDYNDDVAADVVVDQSPSAKDTANKGDTVTIILSPGQEPITVPNVVGYTQAQAESTLSNAGLKYAYSDAQYDDSVPEGSVISQTKSGDTVEAGTTITLTLSKGKKVTTKQVSTTLTLDVPEGAEATNITGAYELYDNNQEYANGSVSSVSVTVSGTISGDSATATVDWEYDLVTTNEDGTTTTEHKTAHKEATVS